MFCPTYDPNPYVTSTANPSTERVEGMWLGVTVASQRDQPGGRVLVRCLPLFLKMANYQLLVIALALM